MTPEAVLLFAVTTKSQVMNVLLYRFILFLGMSDSTIRVIKHDIKNSIQHVLGYHEQCSKDFCRGDNGDDVGILPSTILLKIKVKISTFTLVYHSAM
jgi:hypothetical protein